tara:strand:- start:75 stop:599 length:525 start_codon:yes stop_codon:yes gene_type:complete
MQKFKKYLKLVCISLVITFLIPEVYTLANTQPQLKSRFGDWSVFTFSTDKKDMCYIASTPIKQDPKDKNWNPNFFISRIDKNYNQPSLNIGYKLKDGTSISVKILNNTFALTSNKDGLNAWLMTEDEEKKLVEAMKKGYQMIIKGTSEFGTNTTDHYSLKGVIRSLQELDSVCS